MTVFKMHTGSKHEPTRLFSNVGMLAQGVSRLQWLNKCFIKLQNVTVSMFLFAYFIQLNLYI